MKSSNLIDYPNYRVSKRGRVVRISDGKIIKCYLNRKFNRYYCWLYNSNNHRIKVYRYRLVAMAWIPNPGNKPEVCHIDNNSIHDYYKNLYWGTHKENMEQMARDGRSTRNRGIKKLRVILIRKRSYQNVSFEVPIEKLEVIVKNFFGSS
jgi:hypothetical protein